jgi:hypothetical protein
MRVQNVGFRVEGEGLEFMVLGSGIKVKGVGFTV